MRELLVKSKSSIIQMLFFLINLTLHWRLPGALTKVLELFYLLWLDVWLFLFCCWPYWPLSWFYSEGYWYWLHSHLTISPCHHSYFYSNHLGKKENMYNLLSFLLNSVTSENKIRVYVHDPSKLFHKINCIFMSSFFFCA